VIHAMLCRLTAIALAAGISCSSLAGEATELTVYTTKGEVSLNVELATTPQQRQIGLMNRETLKPHDGMLFLFPTPHDYSFWMKNTMIPLDMLFVNAAMQIVHIEANATPYTLSTHASGQQVVAVIELDGGRAAREGIAVKDHIRYVLPPSVTIE